MSKKIGITFFFGVLLASVAWFNLAPIIPPPGATGSTGPQGSPGISGSPGPQGSPGPAVTGGVIGTASFAGGDPISSFVSDGVITSAVFSITAGHYAVTITAQPNSNYIPVVTCNEMTNGVTANVTSKTNTNFELFFYDPRSETAVDPTLISVAVLRLSQ